MSKIVRNGSNYERTIYIDGIFEYVSLGTLGVIDYEKNYINVMDDKSRIAEVRVGDVFPTDISDSITYILEDQIGSSVVRLSDSGTIADEEEYYPFGDSSLRTFTYKRYRYVGKERDAESGLYYYGARYYAAWTCRFISVDPLAGDYMYLTPYNYAANNPINDYDIDGRQNTQSRTDSQKNIESSKSDKANPNKSTDNIKAVSNENDLKNHDGAIRKKLTGSTSLIIQIRDFTFDEKDDLISRPYLPASEFGKNAGEFDYLVVESIQEAEKVLKETYGDKADFLENVAIMGHGGPSFLALSKDVQTFVNEKTALMPDAQSTKSVNYLNTLMTNNARILIGCCSVCESPTSVGNVANLFVKNTNRSLFLSTSETQMKFSWDDNKVKGNIPGKFDRSDPIGLIEIGESSTFRLYFWSSTNQKSLFLSGTYKVNWDGKTGKILFNKK